MLLFLFFLLIFAQAVPPCNCVLCNHQVLCKGERIITTLVFGFYLSPSLDKHTHHLQMPPRYSPVQRGPLLQIQSVYFRALVEQESCIGGVVVIGTTHPVKVRHLLLASEVDFSALLVPMLHCLLMA